MQFPRHRPTPQMMVINGKKQLCFILTAKHYDNFVKDFNNMYVKWYRVKCKLNNKIKEIDLIIERLTK